MGYRNLHTLNDPAKLGSWLYAIAHRTSLDFAKRSKRKLPLHETAPSSDIITPWLEQYVIHDSVWGALQELEEKSKSVVVLHYLSEWSMKEIGQFLNRSVSDVESRIRRAREVLKQHLARDFEHYFHTPSGNFFIHRNIFLQSKLIPFSFRSLTTLISSCMFLPSR